MVEDVGKRKWTKLEDLMLAFYIAMHGAGNWDTMARDLDIGRRGISCRHRWSTKLMSPAITDEQIQRAAGGGAATAEGGSLTSGGAPSGCSDAILKELEAFLMNDG